MVEARKLAPSDLRDIVTDPSELAKGTRFFDDGGLTNLARFQAKLFADAAGSGTAPYKVQVVFEEKGLRGRCSCMAARTRPFCKHAAALLVGWSRAPESFAEAAHPPEGLAGAPKKKSVKQGKVDAKEFMARGVERVTTLVRELAVSGVASLAADRVAQVHELGDGLREAKLRRVSARTLELSEHLARAAARSDAFEPSEYTELVADLLLTARKLEKHIAGEPLADEHVEELIGKTWTKKDRRPIAELDLVEVAYASRLTPDDFVIRESRFVDLRSGHHFSEKQILPGFLAKRTPAKRSWAGQLLRDASGSLYPTYPPRRLDLDAPNAEPLDERDVARLVDVATPDVASALAALQERRKDVFAPEAMPATLRASTIVAERRRLQLVDATGAALFLPEEDDIEQALVFALRDRELTALVGDVALDGALPTFFPLAMVTRTRDGRLALVSLGSRDAATRLETRKARRAALERGTPRRTRWVDVARAVGASTAAIALGEVRDEMASALALGLGSATTRFTDPLASRLTDLGLTKQAELLKSIGARPDPAEKLDDFIKLHQVLGIALTRLAGATHVERAALAQVPTYESVFVREPEAPIAPRDVARLAAAGTINRWEAALHYARFYEDLPTEDLAETIYPTWADGSATPFIARAFLRAPELAARAARKVLFAEGDHQPAHALRGYLRVPSRVAKLTAVRVLATAATPAAKAVLDECVKRREHDGWLATLAQRALWEMAKQPVPEVLRTNVENLTRLALGGAQKDDRAHALGALAKLGAIEAIPVMRACFVGDQSADVREAAAYALARVGDVDSVDTFVRMLAGRAEDPATAKVGAYALGMIGDVRGIDELLRAYAEGYSPQVVAESLREVGPAALEPLVSLLEARPDLAERKAALGVLTAMPGDDLRALLLSRLDDAANTPRFVPTATLYLTLASQRGDVAPVLAKRIVELHPAMLDKKTSTAEEKALARKCAKVIG